MKYTEHILALLRCALHGTQLNASLFEHLEGSDWMTIFNLTCQHSVQAVCYDAVCQLPEVVRPPQKVNLLWAVTVDKIERSNEFKNGLIVSMTDFFAAEGIRMTVLKGASIADCYPNPLHRRSSDIDILTGKDWQRADRLVGEHFGVEVHTDEPHHTVFHINGVMFENHYDLINIYTRTSSRLLEQRMQQLILKDGFDQITIDSKPISVLTPTVSAVFIIRHMASHFAAERIGLRHLCDWMLYVQRYGQKIDFKTLDSIFEEFSMIRFYHAINGILTEHFGMASSVVPAFEYDRELGERILEDIVEPRFDKKQPNGGLVKVVIFKIKRFWAHRWKHKIVYTDSVWLTFLRSSLAHLYFPRTLKS